jgi:TPR repeat protein
MKIPSCGRALFIVLAFGFSFSSIAETSEDAKAAYDRADYPTALRIWSGLAEQGNAKAQTYLGLMHARGHGVPRDDIEAVQWYNRAAEQGFAAAQTNLGYMYATGRGVAKDDVKAVEWYRKAAAQGNALGQRKLGNMYRDGRGVAKDDAEAVQWYRKAAAQGDAKAQTFLNSILDRTAVKKTYAVVSMVGSRLSFVTRKSTGDRLDHYDRRAEAFQDDTIAATVLRAMANAVGEVAPAAKTELLKIELPPSQGNESVASDEILAVARRALRNGEGGRSWDFIVLLGPRGALAEAHLMGSNLEGWDSTSIREREGVFIHLEYPVTS